MPTSNLVTPQQLVDLYHIPFVRAATWAAPLNAALIAHAIVTPPRLQAFLAQIGHESGRLRYVREQWGPTSAQIRYEGRADLGNTEAGDGKRYLGRGLIQITGRANYRACGEALGEDFEQWPALLEQPTWAARSAAWWWSSHGLNDLADAGRFDKITRIINGAQTGRADRVALLETARIVIA